MTTSFVQSPDLSTLGAGFSDVSHGSQLVFRSVLQALSHPGRTVSVTSDAEVPHELVSNAQSASASVLLALLDAETSVWLSPSLAAGSAATWLRFHTGCTVVADVALAQFVWAANLAELPGLECLNHGTDASPELAATCVVDVPALDSLESMHSDASFAGSAWRLTGPGIADAQTLCVGGVAPEVHTRFQEFRATNHAMFPRGVDVLLATASHVVGLPRTTRLAPLSGHLPRQGD